MFEAHGILPDALSRLTPRQLKSLGKKTVRAVTSTNQAIADLKARRKAKGLPELPEKGKA
jgi:hypothetical protein